MNHAITIGGLLAGVFALAGLLSVAAGALAVFAGGMSDAPEVGNSTAHAGCIFMAIGGVIFAASMWGLLS